MTQNAPITATLRAALYRGQDLLVLHGVVPPTPKPVDPHDHRMWAVIGVYHGQEDNQVFVRTADATLEPTERFSVRAGEIRPLDSSTIHSVRAAGGRYVGAVHVYGGDLFGTPRSKWRDGVEQPNDESALPAFFERLRAHEDALGRPITAEEVTELLSSPAPRPGLVAGRGSQGRSPRVKDRPTQDPPPATLFRARPIGRHRRTE